MDQENTWSPYFISRKTAAVHTWEVQFAVNALGVHSLTEEGKSGQQCSNSGTAHVEAMLV